LRLSALFGAQMFRYFRSITARHRCEISSGFEVPRSAVSEIDKSIFGSDCYPKICPTHHFWLCSTEGFAPHLPHSHLLSPQSCNGLFLAIQSYTTPGRIGSHFRHYCSIWRAILRQSKNFLLERERRRRKMWSQ
jgi:hypothetical protein